VTTGSDGSLWRRFEHDPRDPAYAGMRASDRDRAVVHDVLADAYAEGRLDRDELDERTTQVDRAKTYADLVPPLQDLIVDHVPTGTLSVPAGDVRRSAEQYYRDKLRDAFFGLLIPNLICWAIWWMTGHDGFIWPVFVTIPTLINFMQVASNKHRTIESRIEKLERRRRQELESSTSTTSSATPGDESSGPILSEQEKTEEA
jgi:hypothetical protein